MKQFFFKQLLFKRFFALYIIFILIASVPIATYADEQDKTLAFTMAADAPRTIDLLLYYALKQLGYTPSISIIGNTSTLRMTNVGERDGVAFQTKYIGDQYKDTVMVPHYTTKIDLNAYVNTATDFKIKTWDDLANLRVGMVYEKPYVETRVPKSASITKSNSTNYLFNLLSRGELDAVVLLKIGDQHFLNPGNIALANTLEIVNTYTYMNKKYADLVPKISETLAEMYNNGTADKILNREITGEPNEKKLVLRVSSYNSDSAWDAKIGNELKKMNNIDILNVDLNSERVSNDAESWRINQNLLRADLVGKSPDLILVSDNDALEFIKECYFSLFDTVPVVFCGINNYKPEMIRGFEKHFTGVTEEVSAYDTVQTMLKLFPATKKIFVINDFTMSGKAWKNQIEEQISIFRDKVDIEYSTNMPIDNLLSKIKNLPNDALILCGEYMVDFEGQGFLEADCQKLFSENSNGPIFGLKASTFGNGQIGGKYTDSDLQGHLASEMIAKVLNSNVLPGVERPSGLLNEWQFDADVMDKFHVSTWQVNKLVKATYTNEDIPLYKSNFLIFLAVVLFISLLVITALIFAGLALWTNRRNKRLAKLQDSLYTAEQLLEKDMAVKEMKEYIERLIDTSPIGYALILDFKVIECNKYINKFFGLKIGDDLRIENIFLDVHDQDTESKTIHFTTPEGEVRRFFMSTASVEYNAQEATILWCTDAEEYEKQNDTLSQMQKELETMLETLPLPLVIKDVNTLQIKYCNQSFIDLFQLHSITDAKLLSMKSFYPKFQPDGAESLKKIRENIEIAVSSGKMTKWEWQYLLPNGRALDALVSVTPYTYQNVPCNVEVIVDISDDKKRDKMLQNLAEKEREASKLKSRFLVNMSHEIRTPMNAIIGLSELHLYHNKEIEGYESIKKINQSAKALLSIINDILDFSKLEAEKLQLQESSFVLEELINEVMFVASQRVSEKPVDIFTMISGKIPDTIIGDRNRLSQILQNIMDNAAKFTEVGKVSINVYISELRDPNNFTLTFCIEDTGIGMSDDEISKIFLPFEQFHNEMHTKHSGTGLGTTIVKQLTELMNGEISISSHLGKGTKFSIQIPFKSQSPVVENNHEIKRIVCNKKTIQDTKYRQFSDAKILLCEDNIINQEVAQGILELFGTSAKIANNGQEALYTLNVGHFDLILMDINMPLLDGYETTTLIRNSGKNYADVPIIAMTGNAMEDEIAKCMKVGMNGHVEKPINIDVLYKEMSKHLKA